MVKQYLRNWGLYLRGFRWLWTRDFTDYPLSEPAQPNPTYIIVYKPGWTPLRFLPVYATTYLGGVLLGRGVQSLSGAFKLFGEDHYGSVGPILWGSVDLFARDKVGVRKP